MKDSGRNESFFSPSGVAVISAVLILGAALTLLTGQGVALFGAFLLLGLFSAFAAWNLSRGHSGLALGRRVGQSSDDAGQAPKLAERSSRPSHQTDFAVAAAKPAPVNVPRPLIHTSHARTADIVVSPRRAPSPSAAATRSFNTATDTPQPKQPISTDTSPTSSKSDLGVHASKSGVLTPMVPDSGVGRTVRMERLPGAPIAAEDLVEIPEPESDARTPVVTDSGVGPTVRMESLLGKPIASEPRIEIPEPANDVPTPRITDSGVGRTVRMEGLLELASPRPLVHLVVSGDGSPRDVWFGKGGEPWPEEVSIGRSPHEELPSVLVSSKVVSGLQAILFREKETYLIENVSQTNTTRVNGVALGSGEKRRLADGDRVEMGPVTILFRFE